ncbi:hypothetical protein MR810_05900 [bacterium]|nr:hypothetical protein [bacterium]MDD5917731.1 hypothetical protein [bacterium]
MSAFSKACVCMCAPLACALILSSAAIVTMVGVFVVVAIILAVVGIIIRHSALPGRAG